MSFPVILFQVGVPLITGILQIGLAIVIYRKKGRGDVSNILFACVILSVGLWVIASTFLHLSFFVGHAYFFSILAYIFASFIPYFFLLFTFNFPAERLRISKKDLVLLTVPFAIVILFISIPYGMVQEVRRHTFQNGILVPGIGFFTYGLFIVGYFLFAFINLFRKYHTTAGILKKQVAYIAFATLIPTLIGITADLFFIVFVSLQYVWVGPVSTLLLFILIIYSMRKYRLFNLMILEHRGKLLALVKQEEARSLGFIVSHKPYGVGQDGCMVSRMR